MESAFDEVCMIKDCNEKGNTKLDSKGKPLPSFASFPLPLDPEIAIKWLRFIGEEVQSTEFLENRSKYLKYRLCSDHFSNSDIEMNSSPEGAKPELKSAALPCFNGPKSLDGPIMEKKENYKKDTKNRLTRNFKQGSLKKRKSSNPNNSNKLLNLSDMIDMLRDLMGSRSNWITANIKNRVIFACIVLEPFPTYVTKLEIDTRTGQLWLENCSNPVDLYAILPHDIDSTLGNTFCALRPYSISVENLSKVLFNLSGQSSQEDTLEIGLKVLNKTIKEKTNNSQTAYDIVKRLRIAFKLKS